MTVPVIDGIDHNTFEYRPVYSAGSNFRGIFEWGMLYKETDLPPEIERSRTHRSEPYKYVYVVFLTFYNTVINRVVSIKHYT